MTAVPEVELVTRLKKGDQIAFKEIYLKFNARIYNFCIRLLSDKEEAKDVLQYVFVSLWDQRERLDPDKPIEKYIYSLARYSAYHILRRRVYQQAAVEFIITSEPQFREVTSEEIIYNELKCFIDDVIEQLPPRRKEIFKLNRNNGLTYKEIASKLNISENTVDTQMRHSLSFIRLEYSKKYS